MNVLPSKRKVIALLFRSYDREVDQYKLGILQYARPKKNWAFVHCRQKNVLADLLREDGQFDGGIGELGRPDLWAAARLAHYPVVNLYGGRGFGGMPVVGIDDRTIGRMAANHLMEQGHRNFAFFGLSGRGFSLGRWAGFSEELHRHGFSASRFKAFHDYGSITLEPLLYVPAEREFAAWLASLPRPCGVFACDDLRAEWLSVECLNLGLQVPEDISIVGVDDNEIHCSAAIPKLTSIRLPVRKAGFEAARLLDRILEGEVEASDAPRIFLPPESLQPRESTDLLAISDSNLIRALKYIRMHAYLGRICVEDVVAQTSYCRRLLETRFKAAFGKTIFQEIRHLQVEHAKKLLRETPETMEAIADSTGWSSASHFGIEFKKMTGCSPGEYRRKMK